MELVIKEINETAIAVVKSEEIEIRSVQDALDILGNCDYQGAPRIIIHEENITVDFFDLKTGLAGEILQKFSNYRKCLAVIGDFTEYKSKSLQDFIFECNKARQINFVDSMEAALNSLT